MLSWPAALSAPLSHRAGLTSLHWVTSRLRPTTLQLAPHHLHPSPCSHSHLSMCWFLPLAPTAWCSHHDSGQVASHPDGRPWAPLRVFPQWPAPAPWLAHCSPCAPSVCMPWPLLTWPGLSPGNPHAGSPCFLPVFQVISEHPVYVHSMSTAPATPSTYRGPSLPMTACVL